MLLRCKSPILRSTNRLLGGVAMRVRIWASIVVSLFLVSLLAAQVQFGVINGVVIDTSGAALPGATVELTGGDQGGHRTTVTNERGQFTFVGLQSGQYTLNVTLSGFSTYQRLVTLASGRTERLTIELRVGALEETITVTGETPAVDRQRSRRAAPAPRVAPVPPAAAAAPAAAAPPPAHHVVDGRLPPERRYVGPSDTESYDHIEENRFRRADDTPLSTFSIDVDTASYANLRRFLNDGDVPPAGAVRIEELINYFRFDYPQPSAHEPFSITTELTACPWNRKHRLALIGLQGEAPEERDPVARNLVFLIDVSGSMKPQDKLPLVRTAMHMLTDILNRRDRVAIVVYAGSSGLVLPSTSGDQKNRIHEALARLEAGGSTNGAEGIQLAYQVARRNFVHGGVNRVVLATDGDFNVGVTSQSELVELIERERESGIFLSVLGVGTGNLKDSTMEKLADKGNGNYSYLDSVQEAKKVLVREAGGTLDTIAKDVKIQVEFNPREVAAYRLIGYENRVLNREDFNNDRKDAGDIGAGHSVTALYEIVPAGVKVDEADVDPLKYQRETRETWAARSGELMTVKVRYKAPDGQTSKLLSRVLVNRPSAMTPNVGFASAVAEFGMLLRGSPSLGQASFESASARARQFQGEDEDGYREEFIRLVERAASLRWRYSSRESRH
jgi:Ca-activated chloride channel homolog